jgi:hypothetical protein
MTKISGISGINKYPNPHQIETSNALMSRITPYTKLAIAPIITSINARISIIAS